MSDAAELFYGSTEGAADPFRALPVKLHRAREAFTARFRPTFQTYDLSDSQWRVLRILSAVEEIDITALAKRSMLLGPSLSRILRDLHQRKLVVRWPCPEDARRTLHAITPSGRALIEAVAPQFDPVFAELKGKVGAAKVREINRLLDDVLAAIGAD